MAVQRDAALSRIVQAGQQDVIVVLPAPLGPTSTTSWPGSMVKATSSTQRHVAGSLRPRALLPLGPGASPAQQLHFQPARRSGCFLIVEARVVELDPAFHLRQRQRIGPVWISIGMSR